MPPDSTVQELDQLYTQAKTARGRLEPVWFMNLAYFLGEQWLAWDSRGLYRPEMRKGAITYVDNRIQPIVRKELARLTKNRPIFNVVPNSPDEDDTHAAKLGDDVLTYLWRHLQIQKKRMQALRWSRICCAGFLKVFWDPSVGDSVEVLMDPSGQNMLSGPSGGLVKSGTPEAQMAHSMATQQGQQLVVKRICQGEIRIEVRSPFQMFPDPLADQFEEVEWLVEESVKSKEYVLKRYGVEVEADTPANPGLIEARMGQGIASRSGGYKGVKIREYWCKPNATHPQGYRCVWAGGADKGQKGSKGQVLAQESAPFDPMPYVMFSSITVPGRLWPTSITEQLRGPQTELNKAQSQVAENAARIGNPTLMYSRNATRNLEELNRAVSQAGGMVGYDETTGPNAMPSYLNAPPIPEYIAERPQTITGSLQEISGQHEVSSAQVPPGVTAASAIDLLQEADDTMIAPDVEDHEEELAVLGEKLLNLVGRYYDDTRVIRIGGDNAAWEIFDFKGSMLRGNTRVQVQAGSAFPRSKAAKQAQMQDFLTYMAQSGQPLQGRQLAQFLEDFGMGGTGRFIEQYTINETQCNRENALMAQGQELQTNDYDDDEAHIANHEDFQRQPRYGSLPPQVQQIFETHVAAHRQKLAMIQQQQAQMQLQAQGQDPQAQAQEQQQQMAMQQQQAAQQSQTQGAQAQQQMDLKGAQGAQQQGLTQAQAQQQQQHAEELHAQKIRHQEEQHQVRLRQQAQAPRQGAQK